MSRRQFLLALLSAWLGLAAIASPVLAKDGGESDGGESDGGDSDGGDSESDGDGEGESSGSGSGSGSGGGKGSGSGNGSGSGSGHGNGKGSGKSGSDDGDSESESETEHEEATEAVRRGEVMSYRDVIGRLKRDQIGRVLKVELDRSARGPVYRMRVEDPEGFVSTLVVDARTGRLIGWGER